MNLGASESKIVRAEVIVELKECCARHLPAIVAQPETETSVKAAFSLLQDNAVRFEVRGQAGAVFKDLAPAVVSYLLEGTLHVFVGSVTGFVPSTSTGYLTMTLPPFVIQPDMRRFFRVPLIDPGRVQVRMEDQGYAVYEPQLVDISVGGMLIEFPVKADPRLDVKSALKVQLQLDEQIANYLAEVRHTRPGKYGLMFVEAPNALDSVKEESALKEILAAVERAWLTQGR
ncbi:MAG: PilZ domain-containing protein [Candidatus Hydrogenedentes bacterium]|nr:PilZ domain-containing protein [Candidatus Hydrogenedentota bacterium]